MNNIYDIWFARVEVANSIKYRLYKNFSTQEIYNFKEEEFLEQRIKSGTIIKFLEEKYRKNLEKYQEYMERNQIMQIFYQDEKYPERLKNISDFPTYIFVKRKYRINVWR